MERIKVGLYYQEEDRNRVYSTSSTGSSWSAWTWGQRRWNDPMFIKGYTYTDLIPNFSGGYLATKHNLRSIYDKYPGATAGANNVPRGVIKEISDQVMLYWTGSGGGMATVTVYILDVDPRTLNATQIAERALGSVTTYIRQQPSYANSHVQFNITELSIPSRSDFYIVQKIQGNSVKQIYLPRPTVTFNTRELSVSVWPQDILAGKTVTVSFDERMDESLTLTFKSNGKVLHTMTATSDAVEVQCPRSWFATAEQNASNTLEIEVTAKVASNSNFPGDQASGNFSIHAYELNVTSPLTRTVGEFFEATIIGATSNDHFTATLWYGNNVLHQEALEGVDFSVECLFTFFSSAGMSANGPLSITAAFKDQDGKTVSTEFILSVIGLTVSCDKGIVTTGEGADSSVTFTVGNHVVNGHSSGKLKLKLKYSDIVLESRTLTGETATVKCIRDWFETVNVRNSPVLTITVYVEDEYGRNTQSMFILNAGKDMEPIMSAPSAVIVQAPAAMAFPTTYIAGYSRAKISMRVTLQTSARIVVSVVSYSGAVVVMRYNSDTDLYEATTPDPLLDDTVFTVKIEDERGFVKTGTVTVDGVYHYIPPSFKVNSLFRCDENGEQSTGGVYYKINVTATYDTGLEGNSIVLFNSTVEGGTSNDIVSDTDYIFPTGYITGKRVVIRISIKDLLSNEITATWTLTGGINLIQAYNALVDKYHKFNDNLKKIQEKIIGFPALMEAYFNTIDMELFLRSGLMPNVSVASTNAQREAAKLTSSALSPVAVVNINSCSASTAASSVLSVAKCIVRDSFKVSVKNSGYDQATHVWRGSFTVTNYSDEDDTAESAMVTVNINSNIEKYIRQKIDIAMKRESDDVIDITELFKLSEEDFKTELGKYCMQRLLTFRQVCQACLDTMLQTGASSVSKITNLIKFNSSSSQPEVETQAVNKLMFNYDPNYNYPDYKVGAKICNGITYVVRNDGTILVNGTSTGGGNSPSQPNSANDTLFSFNSYYTTNKLKAGVYTFNLSATVPGIYVSYVHWLKNTADNSNNSTHADIYKDTFTDGPLNIPVYAPNTPYDQTHVYTGQITLIIYVPNGITIDNAIIKPMFEAGSVAHSFTTPLDYTEQTEDTAGASIQTDATKEYAPNKVVTIKGVRCAVNADGSILLNGTATDAFQFYFSDQLDDFILPRGYYIYTLNTTESGVGAFFGEKARQKDQHGSNVYSIQNCVYRQDDHTNGPFKVIVEGEGTKREDGNEFTGDVVFGFSVERGTFFANYLIKPQLEAGMILHDWIPISKGSEIETNLSQNDQLYYNLYQPYFVYLGLIEEEIKVREHEIEIVAGEYDSSGRLVTEGVQNIIEVEKEAIQKALNFEAFLGTTLLEEFSSYRREDNLSNQYFISDGLTNTELFRGAQEYIQLAEKEIRRAAESQHSISGDLYNMLTMPEFRALTKDMCVGNWIRVGVDGTPYKIRLYSYEIDYDDMGFSVEFTNLQHGSNGSSDVSDLLGRVRTMSVSYNAVARQAESGRKTKKLIDDWEENGIPLFSKIAGVSGNQEFSLDQGGFGGKEFETGTDIYSPTQVKFTAGGLFATTDTWLTGKTVVGKYQFENPVTGQTVEGYGSIAELLLGHMILSNSSMIFNEDGSILISNKGIKTKTLDVSEDMTVAGDVEIGGVVSGEDDKLNVESDLDVKGDTKLTGEMEVTGEIKADSDMTVGGDIGASGNLSVTGHQRVRGKTGRVVRAGGYGDRMLYSYQTAGPMFGDTGEGVIDSNGSCSVTIDAVFAQTVNRSGYQVFLQKYGEGECYVSSRGNYSFTVKGQPGLSFGWEIKAKQAGYESTRMESVT